jgi:hypothetical protein
MKIKAFIRDEALLPRLQKHGLLIVYDPDARYRELCLELAAPTRRVVDASEGSIDSRELALAALQELGETGTRLDGLLVYVPARAPQTDEQRQRDPFAVYAAAGAVFPDGDEYLSLCLRARPDHATEIRRLFADNPNPSFAVIDAVGGGAGWPTLQALLQTESARDLLHALHAPSEAQAKALKGQEAWVAEARDLVQRCLGLKLLTRGKTWAAVADELWRFVLFSEFASDLPVPPPDALANVPRAAAEARPVIEDVCDRLRNDRRTQAAYIARAERVEKELNLPGACAGLSDLGVRETFPFEERSLFAAVVEALAKEDGDRVRRLLARRADSVWVGRGENQSHWALLESAAGLLEACSDAERQLPDHCGTQEALLDFYAGSLRDVDRRHRELEQAAADLFDRPPGLDDLLARARRAYRRTAARAQDRFIGHLEKSGWPPAGRLANAEVFDRLVAPHLQESGRRVAYVLVDALRYELGVELHKQLAEDGQAEVRAAHAQLPTVTPVRVASLLPGAGKELRLTRKGNELVVALADQPLPSVTQRMEVFRKRYGQRFAEVALADVFKGKFAVEDAVELLVIRTNTMDAQLEATPDEALAMLYGTLKRIRAAIRKLAELRFREVVIATDHGFFLNAGAGPGDVCPRPPGDWLALHERFLLGEGADSPAVFSVPAAKVGIRGDFGRAAGPKGLACFRAGELYFHGGASLQEAVVPVIVVRLRSAQDLLPKKPTVELNYKDGAKKITTRLPVVRVKVSGDLYSPGAPVELQLEAHDRKGNVVGEARPGGPVNAATRTVAVAPGKEEQVTLRMDPEYEGKFTVKALYPATLTAYAKLDLETDYTV